VPRVRQGIDHSGSAIREPFELPIWRVNSKKPHISHRQARRNLAYKKSKIRLSASFASGCKSYLNILSFTPKTLKIVCARRDAVFSRNGHCRNNTYPAARVVATLTELMVL